MRRVRGALARMRGGVEPPAPQQDLVSQQDLKAVNVRFVETVKATFPFYVVRLGGGLLYLAGMLVMAWNVFKTATSGRYAPVRIPLAAACA